MTRSTPVYVSGRSSKLTCIPLMMFNVKCFGLPPWKISSLLRPVKDHLGVETPGVSSITCECGQVYIGQTGRSIQTRVKDHHRHTQLGHSDKPAVAERRFNHNHVIKLQETRIISTVPDYMERLIRDYLHVIPIADHLFLFIMLSGL